MEKFLVKRIQQWDAGKRISYMRLAGPVKYEWMDSPFEASQLTDYGDAKSSIEDARSMTGESQTMYQIEKVFI